jgi:hypothetical protein
MVPRRIGCPPQKTKQRTARLSRGPSGRERFEPSIDLWNTSDTEHTCGRGGGELSSRQGPINLPDATALQTPKEYEIRCAHCCANVLSRGVASRARWIRFPGPASPIKSRNSLIPLHLPSVIGRNVTIQPVRGKVAIEAIIPRLATAQSDERVVAYGHRHDLARALVVLNRHGFPAGACRRQRR